MLFTVVDLKEVPVVERSLLIFRVTGLLRAGLVALPCHSNQYAAHYAYRSGTSDRGSACGAFFIHLLGPVSDASWARGAVLSSTVFYFYFKLYIIIMTNISI